MQTVRLVFLFMLLSFVFISCKKDNNNTVTKGAITGTITLWNDKTTSQTDASGVVVSIANLPGKTFTTSANGQFRFEDVPFDTYELVFTKAGYGTFKIFGLSHAKPSGSSGTTPVTTIVPAIQMGAQATTTITTHSFTSTTFNGSPGVSYSYGVSPSPSASNRGYVRAFLSTSASVSNTNYAAYSAVRSVLSSPANGGFSLEELNGFGFSSGQTVYIKLYGESFVSNDYTDPSTGKRVFPNLNATSATAISFIVP